MTKVYRNTATGCERLNEDGSATPVEYGTPEFTEFFEWLQAGGVPLPLESVEVPAPSPVEQLTAAQAQLAALTEQINALQAQIA